MARSDRFAATIESIYAAGVDDTRWSDALLATARLTGSLAASFEVFDKANVSLDELYTAGLPPQAEIDYLNHYSRNNPRAEYAFGHLWEVTLTDYQILNERAMDRSAYYTKYLKPIDLRYFLSGQLFNTANQQAIVSIQRTRRQGHVDRADVDLIRRLVPHFRRAHDMAKRLRTARNAREPIEDAIDWLSDGIALLGADGTVIHANAAMLAVAASEDGIRLSTRGLELAGVTERSRLSEALGAADKIRRKEAVDPGVVDFPVTRASGAPAYVVCVRPLVHDAAGERSGTSAAFVVFVHDPLADNPVGAEVLRAAFGFTEAEAELARALHSGTSPAAYARRRSLSVNTVYTHLRRIKEKTGTTRIADLINRLDGVRTPLRGD